MSTFDYKAIVESSLLDPMKVVSCIIVAAAIPVAVSFAPSCPSTANYSDRSSTLLEAKQSQTRSDFLVSTASVAAIVSTAVASPIQPAYARGRATLEPAYEKYSPRRVYGIDFCLVNCRVHISILC